MKPVLECLRRIRQRNCISFSQVSYLIGTQHPIPDSHLINEPLKEPTIPSSKAAYVESTRVRRAHSRRRRERNIHLLPIIVYRGLPTDTVKGHCKVMPLPDPRHHPAVGTVRTPVRKLGKRLHVPGGSHLSRHRPVGGRSLPQEPAPLSTGHLEPPRRTVGQRPVTQHLPVDVHILFLCLFQRNGSRPYPRVVCQGGTVYRFTIKTLNPTRKAVIKTPTRHLSHNQRFRRVIG